MRKFLLLLILSVSIVVYSQDKNSFIALQSGVSIPVGKYAAKNLDYGSFTMVGINAGTVICYDPNIRSHDLSQTEIKKALFENIAFADIVKASDQDMENIFGKMSNEDYNEEIKKINPNAIFILTLGSKGAIGFKGDIVLELPAKDIDLISTIGAGDAFNAGMVFYLVKNRNKVNILKGMSENSFVSQ